MRHATQAVTIFHPEYDRSQGYDIYKAQILKGVSFFGNIATNISKDGLTAAVAATMRIPKAVRPIPDYNPWGCLKIENGDFVLLGIHTPNVGLRPDDLYKLVDYVYTVVGVTDNTAGREPHLKVVMK